MPDRAALSPCRFWELVRDLDKEDLALLVQFVTGTSKVPLEGFKALQVGTHWPGRLVLYPGLLAMHCMPVWLGSALLAPAEMQTCRCLAWPVRNVCTAVWPQ